MPVSPPTAGDQWTVRRVLEWTIGHLRERGCESPRLDAEVLLAHAWSCPRIQLYVRYDELLPGDVRSTMRELVKRRAAAEPVAYLVGRREFFSLDFEVRPGLFIPRPETETLVMEALRILEDTPDAKVLDLCTGTGCIAVTIAHKKPDAHVTAVDLNPLAVEVAQANAERHGRVDRVTTLHGNLFAPLADEEKFDLIVSNPPYVRDDEMAGLQEDVRDHEPHQALAAGADGLDVVRRIVAGLPNRLTKSAALLLEIDPAQASSVIDIIRDSGLFSVVDAVRDLAREERVIRAVR